MLQRVPVCRLIHLIKWEEKREISSILHLPVSIRTMDTAQKCDRSWAEEWEVELW